MKRNDIKALRDLSVTELQQKLDETTQQLVTFQLQKQAHKLKDVKSVAKSRDDIARIKTVLNYKQANEEGSST